MAQLSNIEEQSEQHLLRVASYPSSLRSSRVIAAAHRDINLLTLLPKSSADGLELYAGGGWKPAPPLKSHEVLVLVGEMLEDLSEKRFASVLHRVVDLGDNNRNRVSFSYFVNPPDAFRLASGESAGDVLRRRLAALGLV